MSKAEAAMVFARFAYSNTQLDKSHGRARKKSTKGKKGGSRPSSRLLPYQAPTAVRLMEQKCPDQLGLPYYLWTRGAVQQFLAERFGLSVSVWTIGRYLKK